MTNYVNYGCHFWRVWWSRKISNVNSNQWLLWLNKKFKNCHISFVIAIHLWCSQFISHLNKCKVQSLTISIGNPLIQVAIVSYKLSWSLYFLAGFPKFSLVDLCCTGAFGASGAFSRVVPLVHNGPTSWLFSSMFSEKISDSGRSNVGSGHCTLLDEECS